MPRAGFYNDNEYRAYPFVFKREYAGANKLPNEVLVDCGLIMGLDSEYDPSAHVVYLYSVTRVGNMFNFLFKTNAPGAINFSITFSADVNTYEWQTIFGESAPNTNNNFCAEEPAWEGFIVVGKFDELVELLPDNGSIIFYEPGTIAPADTPDYTVEPGRIQSLVRAYVRSINVGNYERPRVPSCAELSSSNNANIDPPTRQIIVNGTCIKNNIKLKAGYNCAIGQNNVANTLSVQTFKRDSGTADPTAEICQYGSEIPLYEGHLPPPESEFLSGGPACSDLITSINGITGPNVILAPDAGIQIVAIGDNSIKIDVTTSIVQQNCG